MTLKLAAWQTAELHPGQQGTSTHHKPLDKIESKSWDFLLLEGLVSPRGSRTFQDLRVKTKAFMTITRAANLNIGWLLSACGLVLKAGLLRVANWSLTRGVDTPPRTFPTGTPDCCSRDFPELLGSGCRCFHNSVMYKPLSLLFFLSYTILFLISIL